jgi:multiple sugar transport system permease protein
VTSARTRRGMGQAAILVGVTVAILVYLSPLLWLVLSSFKNRVDIFTLTPKLIFAPTLDNCREAFQNKGFDKNLINSIVVALVSTAIALGVGVPAAYSLSRRSGRFQGVYLLLLLGTRLLPAMVLSVPLFLLAYNLGLSGTYTAVIAAYLTFSIPFTVWMVRGFFMAVPSSLDDAARMDGCSHLGAFLRIVLPLTRGGLAATSIFCLINSWNEFLFALILTTRDTATIPVAVPNLLTPIGTFWGQIAAVGTVTVLPVMIFAFAVQRHMVAGMTGGAIAGE